MNLARYVKRFISLSGWCQFER